LTGLAGAVLLVLIVVELATVPTLGALLSTHVVVGVLLAGPLLVKLGSTGYRFVRYYTRSPAYVRKGPPRLPLRLLAPLLVVTTLVVIGSGIGLVVTGPTHHCGQTRRSVGGCSLTVVEGSIVFVILISSVHLNHTHWHALWSPALPCHGRVYPIGTARSPLLHDILGQAAGLRQMVLVPGRDDTAFAHLLVRAML
jgi:hypothetical protein